MDQLHGEQELVQRRAPGGRGQRNHRETPGLDALDPALLFETIDELTNVLALPLSEDPSSVGEREGREAADAGQEPRLASSERPPGYITYIICHLNGLRMMYNI